MALHWLCSDCSRVADEPGWGACQACGGIWRPEYDDATIATLARIQPGPGIDRYRALLPVGSSLPYLGEGNTPLLPSRVIGPELGLDHLYFKHEGLNPTGAFKDRIGSMAVALARDSAANGVVTASSGNASSAIAAYCAAANLDCTVLLEPGNPPTKLRQTLAAGARVLPVEGLFSRGPDAVRALIVAVAERTQNYPAFVWAPVNPYILESLKTLAYEVVAQMDDAPDAVVCPVGGGDMFAAQWRGYLELQRAGVIDRRPRMIAVQSLQAPPLLEAFRQGARRVETLSYANSSISGINVPFSGDHALAAVYDSNGIVVGVPDAQVLETQGRLLATEGIWVEPAGAAAVAALDEPMAQGQIAPTDRVVCILSGAGFKDASLASGQVTQFSKRPTMPFDPDAIAAVISGERSPGPDILSSQE